MRQGCAQVPVKANKITIVTRRFVEAAERRGLQVHVWTIDDEAEMRRLLDLGVPQQPPDHHRRGDHVGCHHSQPPPAQPVERCREAVGEEA